MHFGTDFVSMFGSGYFHMSLHEASKEHCDCCANDLGPAYVEASVWGEEVKCCSEKCVERLAHVWAPRRKCVPWAQLAGMVTMLLILAYWWR